MKKKMTVFILVALVLGMAAIAVAAMVTGTVTGTGSAINVSLGFTPKWVHVTNMVNGSSMDWNDSMAAGKTVLVTGSAISNTSTQIISSGGISKYAGDSSNSAGFTIGNNAKVNILSNSISYEAGR